MHLFFNDLNRHHRSSGNYQEFTYHNFQQSDTTTLGLHWCQKRRNAFVF